MSKKIKFDDKNFNIGTDAGRELLEKSIDRFGFREAGVVDRNGKLIGGNKRTAAAQKLGHSEFEIIKADPKKITLLQFDDIDLDTQEGRELALALNQSAKTNILIDEQLVIDELGTVAEEWGVEQADEDLIEDHHEKGSITNDTETDIEVGDLYEFKTKDGLNHRLLCGDATLTENWERLMDGKHADLIHTDPPYNINYTGSPTTEREAIENDHIEDFPAFILEAYFRMNEYLKPGGAIYVWHASTEALTFMKQFLEAGLLLKSIIIWNKSVATLSRSDYHWKHEPCIYGWKEGAAHSWHGDRKQTTIWDFDKPRVSEHHPTQKPIDLCMKAISNSTKKGELVVDPFMGSGSTAIGANTLRRNSAGMELDPRYCQTILNRLQEQSEGVITKL